MKCFPWDSQLRHFRPPHCGSPHGQVAWASSSSRFRLMHTSPRRTSRLPILPQNRPCMAALARESCACPLFGDTEELSIVMLFRRWRHGTFVAACPRRGRRPMSQVRIMYWKDIPYGVRASDEGGRVSRQLPPAFQEAVDAAAMADAATSQEDYQAGFSWGPAEDRPGPAAAGAHAGV